MKKIFTHVMKRFLALSILMLAQARAWAIDTTTATTVDNTTNIFSKPWIWIGIAVIIAIKLLGPFTDESKQVVIIRKKPLRKISGDRV